MARDNGNGGCFSEGLVERVFFLFLSTFVDFGLTFLAGVLNKVCGGDVLVPCVDWCCTGVSPPLMNILGTALKSGAGKCFVLPDSKVRNVSAHQLWHNAVAEHGVVSLDECDGLSHTCVPKGTCVDGHKAGW